MTKLTISDLKNDSRLAWVVKKITGFPSAEDELYALDSVEDYGDFLNDSLMIPMDSEVSFYDESVDDIETEDLTRMELDYNDLGYSENLLAVINAYKDISDSFAGIIVENRDDLFFIGESDVILSCALMQADNPTLIKSQLSTTDAEYETLIKLYKDVTLD